MSGVLGCAEKYTAVIHYKGGELPYYQIPNIQELTWQRIIDDASQATVKIPKKGMDPECCGKLGLLDCWGFELSIYRDGALVWQGPIYDLDDNPFEFIITARDVIAFMDHRGSTSGLVATNFGLGLIFSTLIAQAFSLDDPNILTYTDIDVGGAVLDWDTPAMEVYIGDEIRELAKAGYDFTTMGRAIVGRLERTASEYTAAAPILTQQHFAGDLSIRRVGSETVTRASVVGDGISAVLGGPTDPFYGQVDKIDKMDRVTDVNVLVEAALRYLNDGAVTPTYIVVPPEGRLLPTAPITIEQLMPSERIDIYLTNGFCRTIQQSFKLLQVNVKWTTETKETVGISVGPLPSEEV